MKLSYCILEKDDKTYNYVREYVRAIQEGKPSICVDVCLQKKEIELHLYLNHYDGQDQRGIKEWIETYSCNFRAYLNSLKMLALYLNILNQSNKEIFNSNIPYDVFCRAINLWNDRKIKIAEFN